MFSCKTARPRDKRLCKYHCPRVKTGPTQESLDLIYFVRKTFQIFFFENCKAQSYDIWCVALPDGPESNLLKLNCYMYHFCIELYQVHLNFCCYCFFFFQKMFGSFQKLQQKISEKGKNQQICRMVKITVYCYVSYCFSLRSSLYLIKKTASFVNMFLEHFTICLIFFLEKN